MQLSKDGQTWELKPTSVKYDKSKGGLSFDITYVDGDPPMISKGLADQWSVSLQELSELLLEVLQNENQPAQPAQRSKRKRSRRLRQPQAAPGSPRRALKRLRQPEAAPGSPKQPQAAPGGCHE